MINDLNLSSRLTLLNSFLGSYYQVPHQIPDNGELSYRCINKSCPSHAKKKNKFCINILKDNAHCWVCSVRFGKLENLVKNYGASYLNEWRRLCGKKILYISDENDVVKYYDDLYQKISDIDSLKESHVARMYLKMRHISLEKALKFGIKYASSVTVQNKTLKGFIAIPSFSFEGIDYIFFRAIQDRFKYNTESKKTKIIFNDLLINWKEPIALVEGVFDAIRLSDHMQAIPILGSSLHPDSSLFKKILQKKPKVVVCLDPDAIKSQIRILDLLMKWGIDCYSMETKRVDLSDSSEEEIKEAINSISPYSSHYRMMKKIN